MSKAYGAPDLVEDLDEGRRHGGRMPKGWFQGLHGIGHQLLQNHLLDDLLIASETRSRIAKASLLGGCGASHHQWPFCGTGEHHCRAWWEGLATCRASWPLP